MEMASVELELSRDTRDWDRGTRAKRPRQVHCMTTAEANFHHNTDWLASGLKPRAHPTLQQKLVQGLASCLSVALNIVSSTLELRHKAQ